MFLVTVTITIKYSIKRLKLHKYRKETRKEYTRDNVAGSCDMKQKTNTDNHKAIYTDDISTPGKSANTKQSIQIYIPSRYNKPKELDKSDTKEIEIDDQIDNIKKHIKKGISKKLVVVPQNLIRLSRMPELTFGKK